MEGTASISMLNMCMSILGSIWFSAGILWQISGGFRRADAGSAEGTGGETASDAHCSYV